MVGVMSGAVAISKLVIDADLNMGSYNITLGAGQTVDGVDVNAGYTGDISEETEGGGAYAIVKTITLSEVFKGDLFIYFETKHSTGAATVHARIYWETTAIGTVYDTQTTGYMGFGEVITFPTITAGQTITLRIYPDGGVGTAYAKNFRCYGGVKGVVT